MGDDITIGVTEIVNNIEVTAQPNDQIVDISVIDNTDEVTLNITPTVIEINVNKGSSYAKWGTILGTLSDQTDLQSALDLKANLIGGKVPASELPSYVDDIIEVANYAALPATGETGKIYVTLDNNKIYRWSGSIYIEIAANNAVWGSITGTLGSQMDLQSALNAKFDDPTGDTTQYIAGDGSLITFPVAGQSGTLVREVRNTTGSTLTKGTIVYINGATGNKPTVAKAIATGDSTSAQTFGMLQADLANNSNGYVVCVGDIVGLDTSAITEGTQLYLSSTTAGAYTTTKQVAPAHLVYIGVVTRSHPTQGQIEVKIQNGYELDEIHDVLITSKSNNDFLVYESASSLWKNKSLGTVLAGTSSQFLKGDGSLDSNTYALTSQLHDAVTIGTANGLSLSTQVLSLGLASGSANGALSSTDWTTFNNKVESVAASLPLGSTGGKSPVISITQATTSSNGYLSSTDWNTFNGKQNALSGTGFVKISGTTISYDNSTYVPTSRTLTINGTTYDLSANRSWTISAGISGSGTTGKISLYTGSTALGDSSFTEFSTYVNLTKPLTIAYSTATSGQGLNLSLNNAGSTGTTLYLYNAGTGNLAQFQKSDNTTAFLINASGNVGIGTTSPSARLHMVAAVGGAGNTLPTNATAIFDLAGNNLICVSGGSANEAGMFMPRGTSAYYSGVFRSDTNLLFRNNDSEFMRITSGGQVQISSPISDALKLTNTNSGAYNGVLIQNDASNQVVLGIGGSAVGGSNQNRGYSGTVSNIDYYLMTNNTERMRVTSGGNVGIGTTSPSNLLTIRGNGNNMVSIQYNSDGGASGLGFLNSSGTELFSIGGGRYQRQDELAISRQGTSVIYINNSNNVGIGTTSPSYTLHVNGSVAGTSAYNNLSDKRYKKDILPIQNALDKILALNGVTFNWDKEATDMNLDDNNHIGLLAQDVEEILPQAVTTGTDENKTKSVAYTDLVPVLIEAIKELKAEIEILKTK